MSSPSRIEIASFPGNKPIAMTFSFDDGVHEDKPVIEFMNKHGLKGTFNLNTGSIGLGDKPAAASRIPATDIAEVYKGHEVAIHTVSHPHLSKLDASQIVDEVLQDRKALEDIVGYPVRGMAYPYGSYSQQVIDTLRTLGIVYCRTTLNATPCFPTAEPLAWHSTAHMFNTDQGTIVDRFIKVHEKPAKANVFFIWGHSYEFARPRDRWNEMETLFKPLAGHDDVWYCTNIELFDYEDARKRIVIAANRKMAYNPSAITVTLVVDGKVVDVPGGQTVTFNA